MHTNTTGGPTDRPVTHRRPLTDPSPIMVNANVTDTKEFVCAMSVSGFLMREHPEVEAEVLAHVRLNVAHQLRDEGYAVPRNWEGLPVEQGYDAMFDLHRYVLRFRSYKITVEG